MITEWPLPPSHSPVSDDMLNARRRVAEAEEALRNCEPEQFLDAQGRYDGFFQAFEALEDEYYEALGGGSSG